MSLAPTCRGRAEDRTRSPRDFRSLVSSALLHAARSDILGMANISESEHAVSRRAKALATRAALDGIAPFLELFQQLRHDYSANGQAARALGRAGRTVPLWATQTVLLEQILPVSPDGLDPLFESLYAADQGAHDEWLLDSINGDPRLARWRPLITECVASWRNGRYLVVVPALFAVLDGLIAVVGGQLRSRSKPIAIVKEWLEYEDQPRVSWLAWVSIEAFVKALFGGAEFSEERPPVVNRNWVMKGRDGNVSTRLDCLGLFQAIDTIASASVPPDDSRWSLP